MRTYFLTGYITDLNNVILPTYFKAKIKAKSLAEAKRDFVRDLSETDIVEFSDGIMSIKDD